MTTSCSRRPRSSPNPRSKRRWKTRAAIGAELERFADNTLEYVRREARLTFEPLTLPPLHTKFAGRHALVVVRGHDYRSDLAALRSYIREYRPVLIGVDGGADALLEVGLKPDVIIGDFDSVSEPGLHCGAELVHHVHPDGRAPGRENLVAWGVDYFEFVAEGTSEDVAMLLAYESGSQLIVAVGTHATMVEFLDKGRRGMASTFLTRLRLGPALVDAKGVSRLYEGRVRRLDMVLLVGAAVLAMVVVGIVAEPIHVFMRGLWVTLKDVFSELMINFRFHIASLIAIFLALALGVVVGAGVIDRGVVDTLNNRLDSVERTSDRIKGENSTLRGENSELTDAIAKMQCYAVADTLVADDIGIVAVRGVDEDTVKNTAAAATCGGGTVTGKLWLENKWALANDGDVTAMAQALGSSSKRKDTLRAAAWKQLVERLQTPPPAGDTSTDLLVTLEDAGFVKFEGDGGQTIAQFPRRGASMLLVVGDGASVPITDVVMPAATAFVAAGVPLVVGEVYKEGEGAPARGAALTSLRDSPLGKSVSTVNDLDRPQGPTTAALALAGLRQDPPQVDHYGLGDGLKLLPDPAQ